MNTNDRLLSRRSLISRSSAPAISFFLSARYAIAQSTPTASTALPGSPAGLQLAWVLDHLRTDVPPLTIPEIEKHFSPDFLVQIPADQLIAVFQQVSSGYGPLVVTGYVENDAGSEIQANVTTSTGESWIVYLVVEETNEHRIIGLQFLPAPAAANPVALTDFDDLIQRWSAFAPMAGLLIAEISDAGLNPVAKLNETRQLAIGSDFKLYVLGAVALAIGAGDHAWSEELAIQDRLKSLPSGELQNQPGGTKLPIRTFAEKMISISDNTAADHLLALVGRDAVEAMLPVMENSDPGKSLPFLSTAELFKLKLVATDDERAAYIAAGTASRRTILAKEIDSLSLAKAEVAAWTTPRDIDTLEWFASPTDLAAALIFFKNSASEPGFLPVADILAINPGISFDPKTWPYVGFKGGSEPGVLSLAWLLRRADQRWFVVTGMLNDTSKAIDETTAILTLAGFQALLAAWS